MGEAPDQLSAAPQRPSSRKKGTAAKIRKIALNYPELSHSQIARTVGCSPSNVTCVLKTFLGSTSSETLRDFQESKADVYDTIQHQLLSSLTREKMAKAGVQELVTTAAILEDKARLVRGQATGINVSVLMDVVQAIRAKPVNLQGNRIAIAPSLDHGDDNSSSEPS